MQRFSIETIPIRELVFVSISCKVCNTQLLWTLIFSSGCSLSSMQVIMYGKPQCRGRLADEKSKHGTQAFQLKDSIH